jgi:hypothetical protein
MRAKADNRFAAEMPLPATSTGQADPHLHAGIVGRKQRCQPACGEAHQAHALWGHSFRSRDVGINPNPVDQLLDNPPVSSVVGPGGQRRHGDSKALLGQMPPPFGHLGLAPPETMCHDHQRGPAAYCGQVKVYIKRT